MGAVLETIRSSIYGMFFTYTTVKVVEVPRTFVGVLNRLLQLAIFAYIGIYIVWLKKGYQEFQEPRGTSVIKVKGVARVTDNNLTRYVRAGVENLWDVADYEIPPIENNAFFIATRQLVTYDQTMGNCPSSLDENLLCNITDPSSCPIDYPTLNTFGFTTGKCIQSFQNLSLNVCEIRAWCPEEETKSVTVVANIDDVKSFTVYIKTLVTYGLFDINVRNVPPGTKLTCRYDKDKDPNCPIIRLGTILDNLSDDVPALFDQGGLIEIRQDWTCNLDFNPKKCFPQLYFNVLQNGVDQPSPGINYRYAQKYRKNDTDYRVLSKVYGLRFVVTISGTGGKFNAVNLFVAIGSGIGFMVIAGIVCDVIFTYCHKSRVKYRERKVSVCEVTSPEPSVNQLSHNVTYISNPHYEQK